MAKKMYYSDAEAAGKLKVSMAELANLAKQGKLRVFMDGARQMYRAEEVDAMSAKSGTGEIVLSPADTSETISLSEADNTKPPSKEDTVITAEGISIFDSEDLEIETADPMAKTQIAPSIEDQTSLEGVGSGSGLLDLTRESDDTSLGAEVLDHIDMEGAVGSGIAGEISEPPVYVTPQQEVVVVESAAETMDASSGFFGGMAIGAALVSILLGIIVMASIQDTVPGFVAGMAGNIAMVLVGCVVVILIAAVGGLLMGKAVAARQAAMRTFGG